MSRLDELKRLAEMAHEQGDWYEEGCALYSYYDKIDADFIVAANPNSILALIAENERLTKQLHMMVRQCLPLEAMEGMPGWSEVVKAHKAIEQRDQARAEVDALRKDAERYRWLLRTAWFQEAFDRFDPDDGGMQDRFEACAASIIDAYLEQEKGNG